MKLIDKQLLDDVSRQAQKSDRLRMNYNFHQSLDDKCHRMLNAVEPGTKVEIHRHPKTSETAICIEGCLDWIIYKELPTVVEGGPVHNGETATDETQFTEAARIRICPREGKYGIQVPLGAWHSIEVYEPSTIFEAKDGAYGK